VRGEEEKEVTGEEREIERTEEGVREESLAKSEVCSFFAGVLDNSTAEGEGEDEEEDEVNIAGEEEDEEEEESGVLRKSSADSRIGGGIDCRLMGE
jgi:hypothetical protein